MAHCWKSKSNRGWIKSLHPFSDCLNPSSYRRIVETPSTGQTPESRVCLPWDPPSNHHLPFQYLCSSFLFFEEEKCRSCAVRKSCWLPCIQRSRQSRWNHTASWGAARHSFCPSWAERDGRRESFKWKTTLLKKRNHIKTRREDGRMRMPLTIGCWSKTFLSKSPCSQNSAATIRATWRGTEEHSVMQGNERVQSQDILSSCEG